MTRDEICAVLEDISQYFFSCYRNAGGKTARDRFHRMMCAVDEARKEYARDE